MIPPLLLSTFLIIGATANSYGSASLPPLSPIILNYKASSVLSPSSYTRTSLYSQPTYSSPSSYSQSTPSTSYYISSAAPAPTSSSSYYGATGSSDRNAAISTYNRNINPGNSDSTSFTTSNGISSSHNVQVIRGRPSSYQDEHGNMVQTDTTIAMNGHSYHTSPEGMHVSLTWQADDNGFSAQGDHLPKPVPMPAEHAEAHRQALLLAAKSPSAEYNKINTPSGGYGGTNSPPSGGYGSASAPSGGYGSASSAPTGGYGSASAPSGGYGGASAPSGGYGGASSAPTGGYGSASAPSGGYGDSNSPSSGGYKGAPSHPSYSAPPNADSYAPATQSQQSNNRYY